MKKPPDSSPRVITVRSPRRSFPLCIEASSLILAQARATSPLRLVKRSPDVRIIGVDLSRVLIGWPGPMLSGPDAPQGSILKSGTRPTLGSGSESFDGVISTGMLHVLRDPVSALRECWRVLKPGQEAWIYDPARVSSQVNVTEWKASLNSFERHMYRMLPLLPG